MIFRLNKVLTLTYRQLLPVNDPSFMIIGAQKSGTSSLHYYLGQHPEITGSFPKEIHFFDRDIYSGKTYSSYRRHFRGDSKSLHFEATPSYFYAPDTAKHIHIKYPNIKLIITLRDPVKRAYSAWNHYRQLFVTGKYRVSIQSTSKRKGNMLFEKFFKDRRAFPSFRECIDIELELIERDEGFEPALIRRGMYLQQLEKYWQYFHKDQILVLGFKDVVGNTIDTLERITNFIGAEKHDWSKINPEPKNVREYLAPMSDQDKLTLSSVFDKYNQQLFQCIGRLNW